MDTERFDPNVQARQLREVHSNEGELIARAMLIRTGRSLYSHPPYFVYERGIFIATAGIARTFGATEGSVTRATRESARFLQPSLDPNWVSEQEQCIFFEADDVGQKLLAQQALVEVKTFNENEPMFVLNREILSIAIIQDRIRAAGQFELRMEERSSRDDGRFRWPVASHLSIITGASVNAIRIYPLIEFDDTFAEDCDLRELGSENEGTACGRILRSFFQALGGSSDQKKEFGEMDEYSRRRFMRLIFHRTNNH